MTQVFTEDNRLLPVTVVEVGPCPVVQVKDGGKDGYKAVQIGFGQIKENRVTQPLRGHFSKNSVNPVRQLREFRTENGEDSYKVGDILTVASFKEGDKVDVIGETKGRGFQGVVKRHGFAGGNATHGSMTHRRGGSYGQCQWPGEVHKGKKMPGHMGGVRRTTQNLRVVKILEDKNILLVKGSVHGANGSTVYVRVAKKTRKAS